MSTTTQKLPLEAAEPLSRKIEGALHDVCEQIAVVGSVRRKKPEVGDIELLCVPRLDEPPKDLFGRDAGPPASLLDQRIEQLKAEGRLLPGRCEGPKQKSYQLGQWPAVTLELYLAPWRAWGVHCAIRTGPADFSRRIVTPRARGGLLPGGCRIADGFRLFREGEFVPTPTETEFFHAIDLEWTHPIERT